MAPKKDEGIFASFKDEDQYYKDFEQKLYDGFHAQKTNLDKLSYIMELSAMASDLAIIRARLKKVPSEVNREDYDSEEEYRQALDARIALSVFGIGSNEMSVHDAFSAKIGRINTYISTKRYSDAIRKTDISKMPLPWKTMLFFARYRLSFLLCTELALIQIVRIIL